MNYPFILAFTMYNVVNAIINAIPKINASIINLILKVLLNLLFSYKFIIELGNHFYEFGFDRFEITVKQPFTITKIFSSITLQV